GCRDALQVSSQARLEDAVKLKRLPGRQPQLPVRSLACRGIERQPLRWRAHAAWQAHADHELKTRPALRAPTLLTKISVVLLIDTEELHELRVVLRHRASDGVGEALRDRATQILAVELEPLVVVQLSERTREIGSAW